MKRFTLPLLSLFISAVTVFAQSPTAPALDFNVFLENGASLWKNETEGPMAMGGNLTLGASYQVSTNYIGTYKVSNIPVTLVVGGKIIYQSGTRLAVNKNGHVKIGDSTGSFVWYKDQNNAASPIRITPGQNYNGSPRIEMSANFTQVGNASATNNPIFAKTNIDFAAAFTQLRANATSLAAMTDNANVTDPNGNVLTTRTALPNQVKINLNNGINVLNISGTQLNAIQQFTYNQQPSASKVLIINVNAAGTFTWNVWNQGGFGGLSNCSYILYNFYNTTTLNMSSGNAVEGTMFAPNADIVSNLQSNIEGQIIAKSFYHNGGEVHYPVFTPSITPTAASYTINNDKQCVTGNSFVFTNTSNGGGTLTYAWDFGDGTTSTLANPTKTYASAGTYNVKLTTTGSTGSNSVTKSVTVSSAAVSGFTVNNNSQQLTGNSFAFTTTSPNGSYTYSWDFGDGQTSSVANPAVIYGAAGPYTVKQTVTNGGCSSVSTSSVTVCSDSVGPGTGGGLESESLGDAIAQREFNRAKNSFNPYINYANEPSFVHTRTFGKKADLKLADLFPQTLEAGDQKKVSTPQDLLELTIATEVLGVDYVRNNMAKAVVLGVKTTARAYNHTKSICDRLRGATLLKVEPVTINGYNFIQFALRQDNGVVEYAIAFVVGKNNAVADYTLQSNWLISSFAAHDAFYNMQVWATKPEDTQKLVADIISNIKTSNTLTQTNDNTIPSVYANKGTRSQQNLVLDIVNNTNATSAVLKFDQRLTETADYTELEVPVNINPNGVTKVEVPVKDGYEYEMGLFINGVKTDEAYLADGNWSLDFDKTNTIIELRDIKNEPNRVYASNEYSIYRSVDLEVNTDDYVTLYRPLRAGATPTNLTGYENFEFTAKGNGKVRITITKASITKWDEQYNTTIELTSTEKVFKLPLSAFKSTSTNSVMNMSDIKMISFGIEYANNVKDYKMTLSSVKFSKNSNGLLDNNKSTPVAIAAYPNPNTGNFELSFASTVTEKAEIVVSDILGRVVYTQAVDVRAGENTNNITLPVDAKGIMFVNINSASQNFATQKVSVK